MLARSRWSHCVSMYMNSSIHAAIEAQSFYCILLRTHAALCQTRGESSVPLYIHQSCAHFCGRLPQLYFAGGSLGMSTTGLVGAATVGRLPQLNLPPSDPP